jgi:hypothetical protein
MEFGNLLDNYTTRFLGPDDLNNYMDLQRSWNSFMGVAMTPEQKKADEELSLLAYHDPRNKVAGTFDPTGTLVSINSGYFFDEFPHWYTYRIFQRTGDTSLNGVVRNFALALSTVNLLTQYAESKNYFTYYNRFSLSHQKSWEKGYHLLKTKANITFRYNYMWEYIYQPNEGCRFRNHKFFFPTEATLPVPSVITIGTLKQEYRREYLIKNSGVEETKNYLINDDHRR